MPGWTPDTKWCTADSGPVLQSDRGCWHRVPEWRHRAETPQTQSVCVTSCLQVLQKCICNYCIDFIHFVFLNQSLHPEQQRVHRRPAVPQWSHQHKSSPDTRLHLGEQTGGASVCGEIITAALLHNLKHSVISSTLTLTNQVKSYMMLCLFSSSHTQAFSQLISSSRLSEQHTDVTPYTVDGHVYLAEVSNGLHRHYYWTPSYCEDGGDAALTLKNITSALVSSTRQ